jgi:hypothetical protein
VLVGTRSAPESPAPGDSRRDLFVRVIDADVVPTILLRVARRLSQTTTAWAGSA